MISWVLVTVVTLVLGYVIFTYRKKSGKSPPGPRGLPLVGNLFQVNKMQHVSYTQWAQQYGPIYKLNMANQNTIIVSDYKMVKEIFSQSVFSGRMEFPLFDVAMDGKLHGVVNTSGPHWEELRHFTLRQLRDFGFGKSSMEELIMVEVNDLIESLIGLEAAPVSNARDRLLVAVVNSLWFIVTGHRYKQTDQNIIRITSEPQKLFDEMLEKGGAIALFVPWAIEWFPMLSGYTKIKDLLIRIVDMFRQPVNDHIKTYSKDFQRDFADAYLKEAYATTNPKSAFYGDLGIVNLIAVMFDLYFAGSGTTSTTLAWMLVYLSRTTEVQEKLQAEIESITGNTRPCSVADRPKMPYTEAVIAETLRMSTITPQGVPHKSLGDTTYSGYDIPKDTVIIPNVYYIHNDPKIWGDPENFRPERFLGPDGKNFKKHEALIPFSIGRRQCLGESLARDSLFLFGTNIFQRFQVQFDPNGPDNGFESEVGFTRNPKPFNVIFQDRHLN